MIRSLTIKDLIAALSFCGAVVMFFYARGVKDANKENNTAELTEKVSKLEQNMTIFSADQQSLILTVGDIKERFDNYVMKQDQLSGSVKLLALKVAASPLEFSKILDGKTFEIVPSEKKSMPEMKIKITPIK